MFTKVLVAEDMDTVTHAVASVLEDLDIKEVAHAQYCDKAYAMAGRAFQEGKPFDLLICDLSFKNDYQPDKISTGRELINKLRKLDPNLKVLVNSVEDHPQTVRNFWESGKIDAYVCKDRKGMHYLKAAILAIENGKKYNSPQIETALKQDNLFVLDDFEINLLDCISKGFTQNRIQEYFIQNNIYPSSKSAIEKRLKELRQQFGANTTPHLIGIVKDLKLI